MESFELTGIKDTDIEIMQHLGDDDLISLCTLHQSFEKICKENKQLYPRYIRGIYKPNIKNFIKKYLFGRFNEKYNDIVDRLAEQILDKFDMKYNQNRRALNREETIDVLTEGSDQYSEEIDSLNTPDDDSDDLDDFIIPRHSITYLDYLNGNAGDKKGPEIVAKLQKLNEMYLKRLLYS